MAFGQSTVGQGALAGNGKGFCGGYDLVDSAELGFDWVAEGAETGSPIDQAVIAANHDPSKVWDR